MPETEAALPMLDASLAPTVEVPDGATVIEVKDLVARYDEQVVLNGIDLTVLKGEIVCIVGGSGSGKSTLLKCMLGLLQPVSGSVRVFGHDMHHGPVAQLEEIYRSSGVVYQGSALLSSMTVWENVALPLQNHTDLSAKKIDTAVQMRLGLVGMSGFEHRLPDQLSGGQRKRVAFARAIALNPPLLFCDEPSAGLDPRISRGIDDLVRRLNRAFHMALVVVTHELESVEVIADRIVMLGGRAGGAQVVFRGTYAEMQASEDPDVRAFVERRPLEEPRAEDAELLRQLVGED